MTGYSTHGQLHNAYDDTGEPLVVALSENTDDPGDIRLDVLRLGTINGDSFMPPVKLSRRDAGKVAHHLLEIVGDDA